METIKEILSPDFLLRNSVYTSVLVGFACPLVGVFLVLRRLVFMGVALPQISSTGVALALSLPLWLGLKMDASSEQTEHLLAFVGSSAFTLAAILILSLMERRGRGLPEGRLGAAYVVSAAASILLLSKNRFAEMGWLDLLKGEIITVSNFDLELTAVALAFVLLVLGLFSKELLFVSFDRETARTFGYNVRRWDLLLYLTLGVVIASAMQFAGVMLVFNFLVLPAVTGLLLSHTMRGVFFWSVVSALVAASVGFSLSVPFDLPSGPTISAASGALVMVAWGVRRVTTRG